MITLPDALLMEIFMYLTFNEIDCLRNVCRRYRDLVDSDRKKEVEYGRGRLALKKMDLLTLDRKKEGYVETELVHMCNDVLRFKDFDYVNEYISPTVMLHRLYNDSIKLDLRKRKADNVITFSEVVAFTRFKKIEITGSFAIPEYTIFHWLLNETHKNFDTSIISLSLRYILFTDVSAALFVKFVERLTGLKEICLYECLNFSISDMEKIATQMSNNGVFIIFNDNCFNSAKLYNFLFKTPPPFKILCLYRSVVDWEDLKQFILKWFQNPKTVLVALGMQPVRILNYIFPFKELLMKIETLLNAPPLVIERKVFNGRYKNYTTFGKRIVIKADEYDLYIDVF